MSTTISIQQLVEESMELSLSRDKATGNVAVVAGDGPDFDMYIFNKAGEVVARDECGLSCNTPYVSTYDYLNGYQHNLSLGEIIGA